jgi:hypothetical protein
MGGYAGGGGRRGLGSAATSTVKAAEIGIDYNLYCPPQRGLGSPDKISISDWVSPGESLSS